MSIAAPSAVVVRHGVPAMGTRFECVVGGDAGAEAFLRAAGEAALAEVLRLHALWSPFEPGSALSRVNARAAGGPVRVDAETFDLLAGAAEISRESGGAFDPTVGPLMRGLGFRGAGSALGGPRPPVGMRHVALDEGAREVRFTLAGIELDVGAIAKGAAIDAAADVLRDAGVRCALLHGGTSSVLGIGAPPGREAWRVRLGPGADAPTVLLRDNALAISAPGGRTVERAGGTIGHVVDPRTGEPTARARSAAVVHARAREADAWSTALLVSGELRATGSTGMVQGNDGRWSRVSTGLARDSAAFEFSGGDHV